MFQSSCHLRISFNMAFSTAAYTTLRSKIGIRYQYASIPTCMMVSIIQKNTFLDLNLYHKNSIMSIQFLVNHLSIICHFSCSPAPSETSSQDQEVDPDMFTATTNMKRETSVMAKVAQYYNPSLVSHVTGWQGDLAERQVSFRIVTHI